MAKKQAKPRGKIKPLVRKAAVKKAPKTAKKATKKASPVTKRERGRPSSYSEQTGLAVCGWIKQGYTLRQIGALPNMPSKATIIRWLAEFPEFCDHYARAGEIRALVMGDEIIEIADDSRNDWIEREGKDGVVELVPNEERISRARARIDARKWLMSKMAPKKFGDRLALTNKNGGPLEMVHQTVQGLLDDIDGAGTGLPDHASRER